jgi:beta-mannosidase
VSILTYRLNCTGVEESSWAFKNTFSITEEELAAPNVDLVFEGVDTFAVITLVN